VADATEHFSGADLAHVCETAAEFAVRDSIAAGRIRMVSQDDMTAAGVPAGGVLIELACSLDIQVTSEGGLGS
jgi:SpoVK/Ycf46/Vps4 family AAA+-type ATPase